jgi:hypothetical protein
MLWELGEGKKRQKVWGQTKYKAPIIVYTKQTCIPRAYVTNVQQSAGRTNEHSQK